VARILRDERKSQRLSMTRLAEQAGLSQSMISLIEHDLRNPTLDTLLRITAVLEIELPEVLIKAKAAALKANRRG
jgi:transcriptional regulator with XRE-family HTH domain